MKFFLGYVFDAFRPMALVFGKGESEEQGNGWVGRDSTLRKKQNRQVGKQDIDW